MRDRTDQKQTRFGSERGPTIQPMGPENPANLCRNKLLQKLRVTIVTTERDEVPAGV